MSKKNLARSALEGGRHSGNRSNRRHSNAVVRHLGRSLSSRLKSAEQAETAVYPQRTPVRRSFDDKLAPVFRWLARQVGRPWNKVHAELIARFDTRTTAGRHILFCHVLPSVLEPEPYFSRFRPVTIDRHGLLRANTAHRFARWQPEPSLTPDVADWLGARRVGQRDAHLYWFVLTEFGAFRQEKPLNAAEAARFRALPESIQNRISPWAFSEAKP
jgi:hypothetical protein